MPVNLIIEGMMKELKASPMTMLIILLLCGYSWYTFTNHADASDVEEVTKQVKQVQSDLDSKVSRVEDKLDKILIINLTTAIQSRRVEWCRTRDHSLKELLGQAIAELRESYREITGETYNLEDCRDIIARAEENGND